MNSQLSPEMMQLLSQLSPLQLQEMLSRCVSGNNLPAVPQGPGQSQFSAATFATHASGPTTTSIMQPPSGSSTTLIMQPSSGVPVSQPHPSNVLSSTQTVYPSQSSPDYRTIPSMPHLPSSQVQAPPPPIVPYRSLLGGQGHPVFSPGIPRGPVMPFNGIASLGPEITQQVNQQRRASAAVRRSPAPTLTPVSGSRRTSRGNTRRSSGPAQPSLVSADANPFASCVTEDGNLSVSVYVYPPKVGFN